MEVEASSAFDESAVPCSESPQPLKRPGLHAGSCTPFTTSLSATRERSLTPVEGRSGRG